VAVLVVEVEHALIDLALGQRRCRFQCDGHPIRLQQFRHGWSLLLLASAF
jgi:hypothetical protein